MSRVLDLTAEDDAASALQETESSGLLSSGHLLSDPLAAQLADGERARYLIESKRSGVTVVEGDDERTYAPDDDYRGFALVTDRRLLYVAGRADGDETVSLPLADVLTAGVERAGVISSALVVETHDGRTYQFPCRGDLEPVVETIRDDAAAWSHAERLLEDADAAVDRARERLAAGNHVEALAGMAEAASDWEEALAALEPVDSAAVQGLHERVAVRREMASSLRRQIRGAAGASAHASAQRAWRTHDYERAAAAYEDAVDAYEASRTRPGDVPTDDQLARRLAAVARERAVLRVAPVADAETAANRAAGIDDPEAASEAWAAALERFRSALELEWGADGRRFEVDREAVRESAAEAASAAIDARLEACCQWLAAGDELASVEGQQAPERAYRRARAHAEAARDLADEVRPDRREDVDERIEAVAERLAGEVDLEAAAHEAPLPADSIAEALSVLEETDASEPGTASSATDPSPSAPGAPTAEDRSAGTTAEDRSAGTTAEDRSAGTTAEDQAAEATAQDQSADATAVGIQAGEAGGPEDERDADSEADDGAEGAPPSAIAEAVDAADGPWEDADAEAPPTATDDGAAPPTATDHGAATTTATDASTEAADHPAAGTIDVEEAVAGARDLDREALDDALAALDADAFRDLIARVWEERGWSTTVFADSGDSVYDVLAVGPGGDRRLLVWTSHRPDGGAVDRSVVERAAATRDRSTGVDLATVVTTGTVPPAVDDRAGDLAVAVVDGDGLSELLVATGVAEELLERAGEQ